MVPNSTSYVRSSAVYDAGSVLAFVPAPPFRTGRYSPWGKLDDFRMAFDRIVLTLIDRAEADPGLGERVDVLAFMVRSRDDDGTGISRQRHLRRTVDPHLCGPRKHGIGAGLGL